MSEVRAIFCLPRQFVEKHLSYLRAGFSEMLSKNERQLVFRIPTLRSVAAVSFTEIVEPATVSLLQLRYERDSLGQILVVPLSYTDALLVAEWCSESDDYSDHDFEWIPEPN